MSMLLALLAKDLLRARRNPLPWLIHLAVPLCITALVGLAFGGKSDTGALGRVRFAVVDEDRTALSGFLRSALTQGEAAKHLEAVFLDRDAAVGEITANKLCAAVIIPEHFTRDYLSGRAPVRIELIKNPAQSVHPAVVEEVLGAGVTGLNAIARNFQSEFPEAQALLEGKGEYRNLSGLVERVGKKLEAMKAYVDPPRVSYEKESRAGESKQGPAFNLFAYLLAGMSAMFLLLLAGNAAADLLRELRFGTFERYHTLRQALLPFLAGKVVFGVVLLLLCSGIMLGGGAVIFRIRWEQPVAVATMVLGYTGFAAGLMIFLVALVPDERLANVYQNVAAMGLGIAGGCAFPPQQLPAFVRDHVSPLLPTYWFSETMRALQTGGGGAAWGFAALKLAVLSGLLIGAAVLLLHSKLKRGLLA